MLGWSIRLTLHILKKVTQESRQFQTFRDGRLAPRRLSTYLYRAVRVWVTLLPTMMLNSKKSDPPLSAMDFGGWQLFMYGFYIETQSDKEKLVFRDNPENANSWIQTGWWGLTRHPNYLGKTILWSGLLLPACSVLEGKEMVAVISPAFVAFFLIQASRTREMQVDQRWGHLNAYKIYKRNTAFMIPYIW